MNEKILKDDRVVSSGLKTKLLTSTAINLVGGNKGGTGKSTHGRALVEGYLELGIQPTILEGDGGNSDVAKFFGIKESFNLNKEDGFVTLFAAIEMSPIDKPIIISLPGGADEKSQEHSPEFFGALTDLAQHYKREIRMHWVIDDKRDGLEFMRAFRTAHPDIPIVVVRNLYFGSPDAFAFFDNSKERASLVESGGRIVDLPALTGRVARQILIRRLTHAQALTTLGFLDRREFQMWWRATLDSYQKGGVLP